MGNFEKAGSRLGILAHRALDPRYYKKEEDPANRVSEKTNGGDYNLSGTRITNLSCDYKLTYVSSNLGSDKNKANSASEGLIMKRFQTPIYCAAGNGA